MDIPGYAPRRYAAFDLSDPIDVSAPLCHSCFRMDPSGGASAGGLLRKYVQVRVKRPSEGRPTTSTRNAPTLRATSLALGRRARGACPEDPRTHSLAPRGCHFGGASCSCPILPRARAGMLPLWTGGSWAGVRGPRGPPRQARQWRGCRSACPHQGRPANA